MKNLTFNELLGLLLAIGLIGILSFLAYRKILDPAMVGGAMIGWVGAVITFFFRKKKNGDEK